MDLNVTTTSEVLASFERYAANPVQHASRLRTLLDEHPAEFFECIASSEHLDVNSRGFRYALVLLRNLGVLLPYLSNPSRCSFALAVRLTKLMIQIDNAFGTELLAGLVSDNPELQAVECKVRIVDLSLQCGTQPTNWRRILRIASSEDGRLRARCVQLLARNNLEPQTIRSLYERGDARSRADLVETLGVEHLPDADALFQNAIAEGSNREAANACVASYRAQDERCFGWLESIIRPDRPVALRISAAWAMAQTRDSRFSHCLLAAGRSVAGQNGAAPDPKLRASALRALTSLIRMDHYRLDPDVQLDCALETPSVAAHDDGVDRALYITAGDHHPAPTDWFLYSNNVPVLSYRVDSLQNKEVHLRLVCPTVAVSSISSDLSETPMFHVKHIAGYGTETSLSRAAKSLLEDWPVTPERFIIVLSDPSLPMDLDRRAYEERCKEIGCELILLESPANLVRERFAKIANAFQKGFRIRFRAPLKGLTMRVRRTAGTELYLSEKIAW